ncbi:hypothetical protein GALMADRAFT_716125 [Galerina marginata CBS 339.88]|uniref:Uncharacterized protein n=1 Tax=Galerina marginata (strain CBS 339.88) TaxID=685588 RepID=A0A067TZL7_GALM3|nr:hypothetical protein GALMADRAFT_716125 [Galerina marginata CBS 339.88]
MFERQLEAESEKDLTEGCTVIVTDWILDESVDGCVEAEVEDGRRPPVRCPLSAVVQCLIVAPPPPPHPSPPQTSMPCKSTDPTSYPVSASDTNTNTGTNQYQRQRQKHL